MELAMKLLKDLCVCVCVCVVKLTLNTNVSLNSGFNVFRCTLVSNFFFLSGSKYTLTYGSDVPPISSAGSSSAWITVTERALELKSYSS